MMAKPEEIRAASTLIQVCVDCQAVHIILFDADMQPIARSNVSFKVWLETLNNTFDDIERLRAGGPPDGKEHLH